MSNCLGDITDAWAKREPVKSLMDSYVARTKELEAQIKDAPVEKRVGLYERLD
jgi:hypothetical protein